ncbi:crotonobetainyl-CoA:carnitine CoA-transferase CaiB-like acyl-CoA transferase [Mumia flava]|uniref:Crotonobetainyl-CoA:carnitine CoA-transferase CaiB-like acyl-CoA transferase n=1 Tax=Mumia flava TaxID=1348852 RepID=A0A2M9BJB0_9ACTN|nr:CoA transferase [Mumia flava]PJJ58035.1 crotonobetainyl-CoA:carnitine CoA-transferase CaiB-like acyl-CoA transferase [Mumia flava]
MSGDDGDAPPAATRPLAGIRVLDLTNVLAGPYCSYQLMLMGAEVVKVEVPGRGDLARQLGPDPDLNTRLLGASFLAQNAGKQSVELDLKSPDGREAFENLVADADVLLENFRPGVMARLGYPWPVLRDRNPALVYCAISGFGQSGPMSQRPAYDQIVQGLSGMMSITGTPDTAPQRVGFPICDTVGGLTAAMAINAALLRRERTGHGSHLDVSMLEASLSAMGWAVSNYTISGVPPEPMGDQNATAAPSGTFHAADGPLNIAANRQEQFVTLCRLIERGDLIDDPRFAQREDRKLNREDLNAEINGALAKQSAEHWEDLLSGHGVPAARILTVPQAVELEQLRHRDFFTDLPLPDQPDRAVRVAGSGVLVDGLAQHPLERAPRLGEHSAGVEDAATRTARGAGR